MEDNSNINILICTANIGNAEPDESSIKAWIPADGMIKEEKEEKRDYPIPSQLPMHYFDEIKGSPFVKHVHRHVSNTNSSQFDIIAVGMQESTFSKEDSIFTRSMEPDKKQDKNEGARRESKHSSLIELHRQFSQKGKSKFVQTSPLFKNIDYYQPSSNILALDLITSKSSSSSSSNIKKHNNPYPFLTGIDHAIETVTRIPRKAIGGIANEIHGVTDKVISPFHSVGADKNHTKTDIMENPSSLWGGTRTLHKLLQARCPSYHCVIHYQRGEMRLILLIRKDRLKDVTHLDTLAGNTGIGSFLPNKGGIASNLTICKLRLSFVTAHLAAHEGPSFCKKRCEDMKNILSQAREGGKYPESYDSSVLSHFVFVFGDLNFRIALPNRESIQHEEHVQALLDLVHEKNWKTLNKHDELFQVIESEDFLAGSKTLPCYFPPTFKLERKAGLSYKTQRSPSYTDRILYNSAHGLAHAITPMYYEPILEFSTSDHKPMRGAFCIDRTALEPEEKRFYSPMIFHLFISDISCKNLTTKNFEDKIDSSQDHLDTHVVCLTSPMELQSDVACNKRENKFKYPKKTTTCKDNANPSWPNEEIHLRLGNCKHGEITQRFIEGAILYLSAVEDTSVLESNKVIGTATISLPSLLHSAYSHVEYDNDDDSEGIEVTHRQGLAFRTTLIDCPLVKFGQIYGYLTCDVVGFFIKKDFGSCLEARKEKVKKGMLRKVTHKVKKNTFNVFKRL